MKFLEGKLRLKVNRKKGATGSPAKLKFLGFSLYRRKDEVGIRVHEKPLKRLMDRLVKVLQYSGPEGASCTDRRLVTAADTADVLETLEEDTDAI
jgi:hypothetical protein